MKQKRIFKTDTEKYELDPYLQLDIMCRKLTFSILNNFRCRPTEENKERVWHIVEIAYKAIAGIVTIDYKEVGPEERPDESVIPDGCPRGEHWDASVGACVQDHVSP